MSIISIQPTFPLFGELDGSPLETGYIYIGAANLNPETHEATVFWDYDLKISATQPIRTIGGRPARNGSAARFYIDSDYSMTVRNKNKELVYSELTHPAPSALSSINGLTSVAGTNTITATVANPPGAYAATQRWSFIVAVTNTGAVTLNISGLGARDITKHGTIALVAGDMPADAVVIVEDDGTRLQLINVNVKDLTSEVRLNTANGYGSTKDKIRRFINTTINTGSDITYTDSAVNGASFTINTAGIYSISFSDSFSALAHAGISVDTSQPTTSITAIIAADRLAINAASAANESSNTAVTVHLSVNDVIRAHTSGVGSGTIPAGFVIARVA